MLTNKLCIEAKMKLRPMNNAMAKSQCSLEYDSRSLSSGLRRIKTIKRSNLSYPEADSSDFRRQIMAIQ